MSKTILYIALFFSCYINSQKAYKIVYKVEPHNFIENKELNSKVKSVIEQAIKSARRDRYFLIANDKHSYFNNSQNMEIDFGSELDKVYDKVGKLITAFNKNVYNHYKKDKILFTRNLINNDYHVEGKPYKFNWELKEESKTILGYQAKKATGVYYDIIRNKEFEIIAWFIPSIPIPAGPDIYFGLPGLVGEVHLRKAIVKMESIEEINESVIKPSFKDVMPYEEYVDFVSKANAKIKKEYN
jgi:GLPGLI family protein